MKYERFLWNDNYSVGVLLIDAQHRHFFALTDQAFDLLETDKPKKEKVLAVIKELIEYGKFHLATEERYFAEFNFVHNTEHIAYHDSFRKKTAEYYEKLEKETVDVDSLAGEIAVFAKDWLSHHILVMDKEYSLLFKEHGLK